MIRHESIFEGERLLIVDDDPGLGSFVKRALERLGASVRLAQGGRTALSHLSEEHFDAVISDVRMPELDGLELLDEVKNLEPEMPFLLMTAQADLDCARRAMRGGAEDLLIKPFQLSELSHSIHRALEKRRQRQLLLNHQRTLMMLLDSRGAELVRARNELESLSQSKRQAHLESIFVLARVAERNDEDTGNHIQRVSRYSGMLAGALGLSEQRANEIAYSAPLHDIGKVAIDRAILSKRGRLTQEEFSQMKLHTVRGGEILDGIEFLSTARVIATCHHERIDGTGYPRGLVGDQLPLAARIVTVVDVFDALNSKRCYKRAWSLEDAMDYLWQYGDRHFDLDVVDAFSSLEPEIRAVRSELED